VSFRQNGVGTGFTRGDAILPKGHVESSILIWFQRESLPVCERELEGFSFFFAFFFDRAYKLGS